MGDICVTPHGYRGDMAEATQPESAVWPVEQVLAFAPDAATGAVAEPLAVPTRWVGAGCDDRAVWGRCIGTGGEPYECVVDHIGAAAFCSCPSRKRPCKHVIGLLLLWARGRVPTAVATAPVVGRLATLAAAAGAVPGRTGDMRPSMPSPSETVDDTGPAPARAPEGPTASPGAAGAPTPTVPPPPVPRHDRHERAARMAAGLRELDRWLDDRMRTGLGDASIAQYATWDQVAARLVDAQVGGMANRVRRLAGAVGADPEWHQHVLAELGMLHLLAEAGTRLGDLPPDLADSVAGAIGWQVRQAEVLEGLPITDHWVVMGRSDTREDRIEVRRVWLRGADTGRWAMLLSFAAYGQSLDSSLEVGSVVHADVYPYPGVLGLRGLIGRRHADAVPCARVSAVSVEAACAEVGRALAAEPWVERVPCCVKAAPTMHDGRWVLTDSTGSVPLIADARCLHMVLACSAGEPLALTGEFTAAGVLPLTVHLVDRHVDVGPMADASFVGAR